MTAGPYALAAFHDENANGKLDFNLTGSPVDALGFSNDAFGTAAAPSVAQVSGRFPPAVKGVLFRNGPAIHDMGGLRYQHWFDGNGMVQRYAITATGVTQRGKVVRTPKFVAEQAAGHECALEPYDLAAVEREAARIRPLDAVAESSSSPFAHRSWSATLPTMQRCTRR